MPAEDVRFLLVHHTSEPGSNYQPDGVVNLLRNIYAFHTGPSKGWPDVAYNFFVDKFGTIYEGRTGSLAGAVRGSATGGNQGYSQLCCFVGDFSAAPPPPPALEAMYSLLAWLADRYRVETTPGSSITFTSLGSNKWPSGSTVTVPTIAGHRDVSQTDCPGEACYALVRSTFPREVTARRSPTAPTPPSPAPQTTAPAPVTAAPATTSPTETTAPPVTDPPNPPPSSAPGPSTTAPLGARRTASDRQDTDRTSKAVPLLATVGIGGAALVGAAAVAARRRSVAAAGSASAAEVSTAAAASGSFLAWRTSTGEPPIVVRNGVDADVADLTGMANWADHLAARWRAIIEDTPVDADAGGAFVVASDAEQALVLVSGTASATASVVDGPGEQIGSDQVTKVWLHGAAVEFVVDGTITRLSSSGVVGPIDRITHV